MTPARSCSTRCSTKVGVFDERVSYHVSELPKARGGSEFEDSCAPHSSARRDCHVRGVEPASDGVHAQSAANTGGKAACGVPVDEIWQFGYSCRRCNTGNRNDRPLVEFTTVCGSVRWSSIRCLRKSQCSIGRWQHETQVLTGEPSVCVRLG
jgi:hypothetical protein